MQILLVSFTDLTVHSLVQLSGSYCCRDCYQFGPKFLGVSSRCLHMWPCGMTVIWYDDQHINMLRLKEGNYLQNSTLPLADPIQYVLPVITLFVLSLDKVLPATPLNMNNIYFRDFGISEYTLYFLVNKIMFSIQFQ